MFFCSSVPTVPQYLLFLYSSVPTVSLSFCTHCSLFVLLLFCTYCSSVSMYCSPISLCLLPPPPPRSSASAVPLHPWFPVPLWLLFPCSSVLTVPLHILLLCFSAPSVPLVPCPTVHCNYPALVCKLIMSVPSIGVIIKFFICRYND